MNPDERETLPCPPPDDSEDVIYDPEITDEYPPVVGAILERLCAENGP